MILSCAQQTYLASHARYPMNAIHYSQTVLFRGRSPTSYHIICNYFSTLAVWGVDEMVICFSKTNISPRSFEQY